ncbi:NAD-dependent epimerase/dehydratase family protein [Christiangramia sabulilitoris]|uniref:NAD-dependent epimerase/dehydratase family protein n=1 Tax=Christiangramia sabulilitoris TaxID=2583991 RepID=A0A550I007_9FLAO|nr:NAD-dependent epimerase/dehydratase family protein [Christiangramia sabulilitoris]TRO64314.1 NAD-dependent epimerase/dehydratase family protein [Christiangramia sabulilitoris]
MILVTGGTGLVGAHLLFELAHKHEKLRAIARSTSNTQAVRKVFGYYRNTAEADRLFKKIEWIRADINDIPSLEKAFENVEYVYHSAALISFDPSDEKKLRKINIEGTANIVNQCIHNKIKKLCYVSSVAAIGNPLNKAVVDETAKWIPEEDHSNYAISKYGAEIEAWRGTQEGIDTVIVNPGIILGPGFWNSGSGRIFSKIDQGLNYHFPKISGFVGVHDVVKSMIQLMESPIVNKNYIVVAENISFEEVFKMTAKHLNKPAPAKKLKKWMIALGWFFQKIGSWFGLKREITYESINGLYAETQYSNKKLTEELNFSFEPIEKMIGDTAEIYRKEH